MKRFLLLSILLSGAMAGYGQGQIAGFTLGESEGEIQVVALEAGGTGIVDEQVHGTHTFSVNGLEAPLEFRRGRSGLPGEVSSSTFLYMKYLDNGAAASRLFYVSRSEGFYSVTPVPLIWLVVVPVALILAGVLFRRMIVLVIIAALVLFYVAHSKGLRPGDLLDGIKEWATSLIANV